MAAHVDLLYAMYKSCQHEILESVSRKRTSSLETEANDILNMIVVCSE